MFLPQVEETKKLGVWGEGLKLPKEHGKQGTRSVHLKAPRDSVFFFRAFPVLLSSFF
jgi:hypothetical protein